MIEKQGWDGMYTLLYEDDVHVVQGDVVQSENSSHQWSVQGGAAPHKPGSTGRVFVTWAGKEMSYYPQVFDLKWRKND